MAVRVGINGFGRTGRAFYRIVRQRGLDIEVVAVNDMASAEQLGRLLRRDSVHGATPFDVSVAGDELVCGGESIRVSQQAEPALIPWRELGVDVVVESSGHFTRREDAAGHVLGREDAAGHVLGGARFVVVSAPAKKPDATFVIGVNDDTFDPAQHQVVSNASCTTNCLVPMVKVLDDEFGVEHGLISTVHAYTGDQRLVDGPHKDPRRARAAAANIVPTSTGAARAAGAVLDHLEGRLDGVALRVPVLDGSLTDLVVTVRKNATVDAVNEAFRAAASVGRLAGVIEYSDEPLVSTDIIGSPASCVFDSQLTMVAGTMVKVFGWYDNEWGYASRLAELTARVGSAA
jgi:glyceraldehyde 3-phosphate dehydrogenase